MKEKEVLNIVSYICNIHLNLRFYWDFNVQSIISFILTLIHSYLFYTGKKKNILEIKTPAGKDT